MSIGRHGAYFETNDFFCTFAKFFLKRNMQEDYSFFDKNVIEFVRVSAEYCNTIDNLSSLDKQQFIDRMLKLLPLLYLKAEMLQLEESENDVMLETFVSEVHYNHVLNQVASLLAEDDRYIEVFTAGIEFSEEGVAQDISEQIADIYQDLKNLICRFQGGLQEVMKASVEETVSSYRAYWGQRLVNALRALHHVKYKESLNNLIL